MTHPQESALAAEVAALVAGNVMLQRTHPGWEQLDLFARADVLRRESEFHAVLREVRNAGLPPRQHAQNVSQTPPGGAKCPLCKGGVIDGACTVCGMAVDL